jgi:hypothetical protein
LVLVVLVEQQTIQTQEGHLELPQLFRQLHLLLAVELKVMLAA